MRFILLMFIIIMLLVENEIDNSIDSNQFGALPCGYPFNIIWFFTVDDLFSIYTSNWVEKFSLLLFL